ncbi:helicase-related protein [Pontibacter sp. HSC-14F20]|uniref:DEAD/DEAH box helicase n=1 Tax=Pontibacter sp. HSC-14F20 TaxID=2864136 RepID=UPI001C736A4C|nr:helicase-related protein [Pontibacter sp. HSC-14F20]
MYVENKIQEMDARRQEQTAQVILERLAHQPGLILADEVGMGKTFVSLAVAVTVALADKQKRPVVIMVPSKLLDKWERDFNVFAHSCWRGRGEFPLRSAKARDAAAFLKLLDDPEDSRKQIIFLNQGAMHLGLQDVFIKVTFVKHALFGKHHTEELKKGLAKHLGQILNSRKHFERQCPDFFAILLSNKTKHWRSLLEKKGIYLADDPVPKAVTNVLKEFSRTSLQNLFHALDEFTPRRASATLEERVYQARQVLNAEMAKVWKKCLSELDERLPLLILDEAHHLKNGRTQLASLFQSSDSAKDASYYSADGALAGTFERMLFLTATPFQLGHYELCNVLDRFQGIAWDTADAPEGGKERYETQIEALRRRLDENQYAVLQLERHWRKLRLSDMELQGQRYTCPDRWWAAVCEAEDKTDSTHELLSLYNRAKAKKDKAEELLRGYVIRHIRSRKIHTADATVDRRLEVSGKAISTNMPLSQHVGGLELTPDALLPFLLAARYTACTPEQRPVFAEGLSSSFEAFRDTRKKDLKSVLDADAEEGGSTMAMSDKDHWYLSQINNAIGYTKQQEGSAHPKMKATVTKALDLWEKGEKVLIFCHYIATAKALRSHVSKEMRKRIRDHAAEKLTCDAEEVWDQLDIIGKRFFREDSLLRKTIAEEIDALLLPFPSLQEYIAPLQELVRRYLRTPSFLVRFYPLNHTVRDDEAIRLAFSNKDDSGLSLRQMLQQFFKFLEDRGPEERKEYIDTLNSIQSGGILSREIAEHYEVDEVDETDKEVVLPNVRLVYGATKQETRRKLMLTFNTPFYPDILIASSVMAEGVDLHLNCRYIIHHDLCWNPSTLEQRTGRVDRIGAKVEQTGKSIHVYLPYIAETQDEKMFRVVKDRERWFKVVMGEKLTINARTAEELADSIPLPEAITGALSFHLEVAKQ